MSVSRGLAFRRASRIGLAIVGLVFGAGATVALMERDVFGGVSLLALGIACLVGAWTGRDPYNPDGAYRSFEVTSVAEDLERLRREDEPAERES